MDAGKSVSATFATNTYLLTVIRAGTGGGTVTSAAINCGASCAATYSSGDSVTLTAAPDSTSSFTGWSGGGCTGTGTCVVSMDTAKSVTATFARITYALNVTRTAGGTVTSAPAGITCGSDCLETYPSLTVVTLTAAPEPGASFAGWSGDCVGTGTCTTTMNAARSISARFVYPLTVSKAGTGGGVVTSAPSGPFLRSDLQCWLRWRHERDPDRRGGRHLRLHRLERGRLYGGPGRVPSPWTRPRT